MTRFWTVLKRRTRTVERFSALSELMDRSANARDTMWTKMWQPLRDRQGRTQKTTSGGRRTVWPSARLSGHLKIECAPKKLSDLGQTSHQSQEARQRSTDRRKDTGACTYGSLGLPAETTTLTALQLHSIHHSSSWQQHNPTVDDTADNNIIYNLATLETLVISLTLSVKLAHNYGEICQQGFF